jgi:hypothetical protein
MEALFQGLVMKKRHDRPRRAAALTKPSPHCETALDFAALSSQLALPMAIGNHPFTRAGTRERR